MAAQQVYLGRESISHLILIVNKSRTNSSGGTCQLDNLILNNVPMPSKYVLKLGYSWVTCSEVISAHVLLTYKRAG